VGVWDLPKPDQKRILETMLLCYDVSAPAQWEVLVQNRPV